VSGQPEYGQTANTYAVLAKLATGGMAEIFLARNASAAGIERYVVLKRVLRHKANDENFVRMFLDEARLAAQLQHPNIAQVYDTGVLGDSYFFTMEYVHGETVREILHRTYAQKLVIPISAVLTIGAAAAAGLHHAHERKGMDGRPLGIVHRDVSPSNVMVSFEGNVKIVDFGVAKATHRRTETQSGTVKGKIAYLSPEQCRGRAIDRRSDLFSLGIVMWEMLVGDRLFKQGTDYETMEAIVMAPSPRPSSRRGGIPPEVDEIVSKLLERDPDKRFQTADEVLEAIERAAVRVGVPLSANVLGRFVRELFGPRPEPWIEMQTRDETPEIVTVTAAPAVGTGEIEIVANPKVDSQLANVPGLPSRSITRTPTPLPFKSIDVAVPAAAPAAGSNSYNEYPSTGSYSSVGTARPLAPRRKLGVWLVAGAAAVAVAAIAIFAVGGGGASERAAAPQPALAPAPATVPAPAAAQPLAPVRTEVPPPTVEMPMVEAPKPKPVDVAKPKPVETAKAKVLEAAKAKPVDAPKPKAEPPKLEPPKVESPKTEPPKSKPKPDCDVDPMSCRR
jgi:serine/threonine-protein kinase